MDPGTTTYVVDNLETDVVYVFRVYAENETGMGDALVLRTPVRIRENIRKYCSSGPVTFLCSKNLKVKFFICAS